MSTASAKIAAPPPRPTPSATGRVWFVSLEAGDCEGSSVFVAWVDVRALLVKPVEADVVMTVKADVVMTVKADSGAVVLWTCCTFAVLAAVDGGGKPDVTATPSSLTGTRSQVATLEPTAEGSTRQTALSVPLTGTLASTPGRVDPAGNPRLPI